MSYTQWLHQQCPETQTWPSVDTFALIQQAKATQPCKRLEILLMIAWVFCFTLLSGFIGQPLLEVSAQGFFWSAEAVCAVLAGAFFCTFLDQKMQRRLIQKKLLELVKQHQVAQKAL
ncbi:hypothetical protein [Rheinheimera soli]|uniref:hypothetical protein n=1 Tax=Rheinheimera soli TaxID=443616 RepID=UPI001E3985A8|nr:hypothetical protein [Rheinheimera soli]